MGKANEVTVKAGKTAYNLIVNIQELEDMIRELSERETELEKEIESLEKRVDDLEYENMKLQEEIKLCERRQV